MIEPLTDPQARGLVRKKEALFPFEGSSVVADEVMKRTDPVLTLLGASNDEREYDTMERAAGSSVGAAILQRKTGVLEAGSRILPSDRSTPAARRVLQCAVAALKNIQSLTTVRHELLYAAFRGWHPAMIQWEQRTVDGTLWTLPKKIAPLDPWNFAITEDGHLHQLRGDNAGRTFSSPVDQYRFMVARAGNPGKPYGQAALRTVWIPYHLMHKFRSGSWQQLNRSLGVPKASKKGDQALAAGAGGLDDANIDADIAAILEMLNHQNILIELGGWTLEMLTVPDAAKNTVDLLNFWDTQIRLTLLGQNLTSEVTGGSFAAAKSHMEVRGDVVRADAREEEGWMNDQLLDRVFAVNFGQIDPEDKPKWRNRLTLPRPEPEKAKMFVDLGGELDAPTLADQWQLTTPDGAPEVLRRQAPMPSSPPVAASGGERGRHVAAAGGERITAAGDDEEDPAAILGDYYQRLTDEHLQANPRPLATGPRCGPDLP